MGKVKLQFKKCPGCTEYREPKEPKNRVALRFRVAGQDLDFCAECGARERYKLETWLSSQGKSLRTEPQYNAKTKRRTLVVLTDPADYQDLPAGEAEPQRVGDAGLLLMPTEQDLSKLQRPS